MPGLSFGSSRALSSVVSLCVRCVLYILRRTNGNLYPWDLLAGAAYQHLRLFFYEFSLCEKRSEKSAML